jgi:hypothetical protein
MPPTRIMIGRKWLQFSHFLVNVLINGVLVLLHQYQNAVDQDTVSTPCRAQPRRAWFGHAAPR